MLGHPHRYKPIATLCIQVVFVHKPSGTLIATDLIWNYPKTGTNRGTQAWKFGMDRVYLPFYTKFMIKDKGAAQSAMQCTIGLPSIDLHLHIELQKETIKLLLHISNLQAGKSFKWRIMYLHTPAMPMLGHWCVPCVL